MDNFMNVIPVLLLLTLRILIFTIKLALVLNLFKDNFISLLISLISFYARWKYQKTSDLGLMFLRCIERGCGVKLVKKRFLTVIDWFLRDLTLFLNGLKYRTSSAPDSTLSTFISYSIVGFCSCTNAFWETRN